MSDPYGGAPFRGDPYGRVPFGGTSIKLPRTESVCPQCLLRIPAQRVREGTDVYLVKTCPEHGESRSVIWRGLPDYESWYVTKTPNHPAVAQTARDKGCPWDCGLCPEHAQRTCCVLLEVTARCDLSCPICFASSGESVAPDPGLDEIRGWYQLLRDNAGMCNIQVSGGEPTVRDDLPEIIAMGREMGFTFFQLNTNGLRLATDAEYARRLKDAGLCTVFLQFDGLDDDVYRTIRGAALLVKKKTAISNCAEAELGVVLVPTLVPRVNTDQVGRIIDFAIQGLPYVRGVHFQPISYFGRYPTAPTDNDRYTLPELMRDIEAQTGGRVAVDSFRPCGCEHSVCSFSGDYLLSQDGSVRSLAAREQTPSCCNKEDAAAAERQAGFVARRWSAAARPADCCGSSKDPSADTPRDPMAAWDELIANLRTHSLTISAMAFQDAWNLDLERLRNCHLHIVAPGGRLVPFCSYNLTDSSGRPLHRGRLPGEGPT
jgi:7,8-dihydro-6-hydroxymethylpterin dimethyltransferase